MRSYTECKRLESGLKTLLDEEVKRYRAFADFCQKDGSGWTGLNSMAETIVDICNILYPASKLGDNYNLVADKLLFL